MRPQLQLHEVNKITHIAEDIFVNKEQNLSYSNFKEIMDALYITQASSFLETEEKIKLPYWKRFSYFYLLNAFIATAIFIPHSYHPLFALSLTLPAVGSLFLAHDRKSSPLIFSIFSPFSKMMKTKVVITNHIKEFKESVATPILKDKKNQMILLNYYHQFFEENNHILSQNTKNEIEKFKAHLENEQYENALDATYQIYKKIEYAKNMKIHADFS